MTGFLRARGLVWSVPGTVLAVVAAARCATWLRSRPDLDPFTARLPAVVLGALLLAVLAAVVLQPTDAETDGSTPRPPRTAELLVVGAHAAAAAVGSVVLIRGQPLAHGGLEMARDVVGLTGLALIGATALGGRLAWVVPFVWTAVSYFTVPHRFRGGSWYAAPYWLVFPGSWQATWVVALSLFVLGLLGYAVAGGLPRPRFHPLR